MHETSKVATVTAVAPRPQDIVRPYEISARLGIGAIVLIGPQITCRSEKFTYTFELTLGILPRNLLAKRKYSDLNTATKSQKGEKHENLWLLDL